MTDLLLLQARFRFPGFRAKLPISGKQKEQVVAGAMTLTGFKNRLPAWNIVAAVPINNHETTKAVSDEVFQQTVQQVDVRSARGRQRARKFEVMIGVAQP